MANNIQFKKFVSEDDIAAAKKKRQEEWEKVRKPDEPEEAPEEVFDPRSLFERLEANRIKKQEEWDEAHRLKNMVKGLENDEIDFLETVSRQKELEEEQKDIEEKMLLAEYKSAVVVDLTKIEPTKQMSKKPAPMLMLKTTGRSQRQLLAGAVRKKSTSDDPNPTSAKKSKLDSSNAGKSQQSGEENCRVEYSGGDNSNQPRGKNDENSRNTVTPIKNSLLPGIGTYSDSESSDSST